MDTTFLLWVGVIIAGAGGVMALIFFMPNASKKNPILILNRMQPSSDESGGQALLVKAKEIRKPGLDTQVSLPTGEKFTIMKEKEPYNETVYLPKGIKLKKGFHRLYVAEKNNLVKLASKLVDTSNLMMDNTDMTKINNRTTVRKLALSVTSGIGDHLIYIVLGLALGVMVGVFAYPEIFHQAPNYVTCTRLTNGTTIPIGLCPQA